MCFGMFSRFIGNSSSIVSQPNSLLVVFQLWNVMCYSCSLSGIGIPTHKEVDFKFISSPALVLTLTMGCLFRCLLCDFIFQDCEMCLRKFSHGRFVMVNMRRVTHACWCFARRNAVVLFVRKCTAMSEKWKLKVGLLTYSFFFILAPSTGIFKISTRALKTASCEKRTSS